MNCPKCNSELLIDRVDEQGYYWYACMNSKCTNFRKAINPSSGKEAEATIKPKTRKG